MPLYSCNGCPIIVPLIRTRRELLETTVPGGKNRCCLPTKFCILLFIGNFVGDFDGALVRPLIGCLVGDLIVDFVRTFCWTLRQRLCRGSYKAFVGDIVEVFAMHFVGYLRR